MASQLLLTPSPGATADPSLSGMLAGGSQSTAPAPRCFDIEPSVFFSVDGTGDRIEFFPPIAVGEQVINMKLVTNGGRDIPARYHAPSDHCAATTLLIDWLGTERLEDVDDFAVDESRTVLVINCQRFVQAAANAAPG